MIDWLDVTRLSFNILLLLERVQIGWLPGWADRDRRILAIALQANPAVAWYLAHKNPAVESWVQSLLQEQVGSPSGEENRLAEIRVMQSLNDLLTYVVDPTRYDAQPFLGWHDNELLQMADFSGTVVIDVGAGTGRLSFTAAPLAAAVYAVEPVENLRHYMRQKAARLGLTNFYTVDGLITSIPFAAAFADIVMGGHVFGDDPPAELAEMTRVCKPGGWVLLCPAASDSSADPVHCFLIEQGFAWARFEEPGEGTVRKYWKQI